MKKYCNLLLILIIISGCRSSLKINQSKNVKIDSTKFIDETYKSRTGVISDEERKIITEQGCAPVYGEILNTSLKTLLDDLHITPNDVFYDLGSGTGKVTIQAYLDYPFKKAVGIELSPTRYKHSIIAKNELKKINALANTRTLEFRNEDITKSDINDATVIFMCATCFPEDLMDTLTKKLSMLKPGLKLLTLKALPNTELHNFKLIKEYSLPMTWSSGSPVYLYELK